MKLFKTKRSFHIFLLLAPSIFVTFTLTGYGLLNATFASFAEGFFSYFQLTENAQFRSSLWFSFKVTMSACVISLVIGLLLAKGIFIYLKKSNWKLLVWLPMLIPHFVAAYLISLLFSQSGLLSSVFFQLGIISEMSQFPTLVYDQSGFGIVLAYVYKSVPFVVLMLIPVFYEIDRRPNDVVKIFGGSRFDSFKLVEWPWLFPILLESGLILFAFIFSAFEIPFLLGVTDPKMLPVLSYQWFYDGTWSERPQAFAVMVILTLMITSVTLFAFQVTKKKRYLLMKGRQS